MYYISLADSLELNDISELYIALDKSSATEMIESGLENVITIKDLCSFGIGGFPIKQSCFDYWFCREFHIIPHVFREDFNVYNRILCDKRIIQKLRIYAIECLNNIKEYNLELMLSLFLKVYPLVHEMYKDGFQIDINKINGIYSCKYNEYIKLQETFADIKDASESSELRKIKKFVDSFNPNNIVTAGTNRIFANYEIIGTETFRMTTSNFNLLGMPKVYRDNLLPHKKGNSIIEVDMVSSHIVIVGFLSGETEIIKRFSEGKDLYTYLGNIFFDSAVENIDVQRRIIKKVMLMILNGAGHSSLLNEIRKIDKSISYQELMKGITRLYDSLPKVSEFLKEVLDAEVLQLPCNGRIWTRDILPESHKKISRVLQTIESQILWMSLIDISNELRHMKDCKLYMSLHDSIYVECPECKKEMVTYIVTKKFNQNIRRILS